MDIKFMMEISLLRSSEPTIEVLKEFCLYCYSVDPGLAQKLLDRFR